MMRLDLLIFLTIVLSPAILGWYALKSFAKGDAFSGVLLVLLSIFLFWLIYLKKKYPQNLFRRKSKKALKMQNK